MCSGLYRALIVCVCAALLTLSCLEARDSLGVGVRRRTGLQLKNIGNHTWRRRGGTTTLPVPATRSPTVPTRREPPAPPRYPSPVLPTHQTNLTMAILVPHTNFGYREYNKVINEAVRALHKGRSQRFRFLERHHLAVENVKMKMMKLTPSPTGKLTWFLGF